MSAAVPVLCRPERAADCAAIATVNRAAFAGEEEARLVDTLRAGGHLEISLIAEQDGEVIGHIAFSALRVKPDAGERAALALAPLAVIPAHQRRGVGKALVAAGLESARAAGWRLVFVLGDPAYYTRFGFSPERAAGFDCTYAGPAFMALDLDVPGETIGRGRVIYPSPFDNVGNH